MYYLLQSMAFREKMGADTMLDNYDMPEVRLWTIQPSACDLRHSRPHGIQAVISAVTLWRCLQQCVLAALNQLRVHWRHQPWNGCIESVALIKRVHVSSFGFSIPSARHVWRYDVVSCTAHTMHTFKELPRSVGRENNDVTSGGRLGAAG
jgi:hypothetical protein